MKVRRLIRLFIGLMVLFGLTLTATAQQKIYWVAGKIIDDAGNPFAGVTISTNTGATAISLNNGVYFIDELLAGTYTLTPSREGCTFEPASRAISVPPDGTDQDFTGTCTSETPTPTLVPTVIITLTPTLTPTPTPIPPETYTIDGKVTDGQGQTVDDVIITTDASISTITDAAGAYSLTSLPAATYQLTPSKEGCTFTPESLDVTVPPDATEQNFVANCPTTTAAGTLIGVTYHSQTGQRIAGAKVMATCVNELVFSDAYGFYRFENLPVGTCRITAQKTGYFNNFRDGEVIANTVRWASVALTPEAPQTGTIIGIIYNAKTGSRIPAATIAACNGDTTKSNVFGFYRFINLPIGSCQITAQADGYQNNYRIAFVEVDTVRWNSIGLYQIGAAAASQGDVSTGGELNIFDLAFIASHYGAEKLEADLNIDGIVDIIDLALAASNYATK